MLRVLRQRNFALLWCGQVISTIGDWLLWIALPFHVYALTGSALATGAVFIVNNLPTLLFGSLAGVFVDRWNWRRTMIGADLLRALLLLPLLLTHASGRVWFIYPVAFLIASVARFFHPAKSAIIPTLVHQENLLAANTLNSIGSDLAMLAGPAFGGILFAQIGFAGMVLLDALTFLASALLMYLITVAPVVTPPANDPSAPVRHAHPWLALWQEWQAGLRLVTRQRTLILGSLLGDRLGIVVMLDLAAGFILVSGVVAFLLLPK